MANIGPDERKLAAQIKRLAKTGDIVMFQRSYYVARLAREWIFGFLAGVGAAAVLGVILLWGIPKARAQASSWNLQQRPMNVVITTGGSPAAPESTLVLRSDGTLLWNGREVKTDDELKEAVVTLSKKLQCIRSK